MFYKVCGVMYYNYNSNLAPQLQKSCSQELEKAAAESKMDNFGSSSTHQVNQQKKP